MEAKTIPGGFCGMERAGNTQARELVIFILMYISLVAELVEATG